MCMYISFLRIRTKPSKPNKEIYKVEKKVYFFFQEIYKVKKRNIFFCFEIII